MVTAFLAVGSNLGDRKRNIGLAIRKIKRLKNTKILKVSKIISSKPQGGPAQRDFLNGAISIKTKLSAGGLLQALKIIEKELGRRKALKNGPRTIDLDILLYGDRIIERSNLKIPHPRMFEREFVVKPLLEII